MSDEKDIKAILEREFKSADIKKNNKGFSYIKPHLVVSRLNEAFGVDGWQFMLLEQKIEHGWVIQYGKIGIRGDDGLWVWKENCGGKRQIYVSGKPKTSEFLISPLNDAKSAVSNCFKRCAMFLGVALHLYGDTEQSDEDAPERQESRSGDQRRTPKSESAGDGTDGTSGDTVGDVKNDLMKLEKKVIAGGMSPDDVSIIKKRRLGDKGFENPKETLEAYGDDLKVKSELSPEDLQKALYGVDASAGDTESTETDEPSTGEPVAMAEALSLQRDYMKANQVSDADARLAVLGVKDKPEGEKAWQTYSKLLKAALGNKLDPANLEDHEIPDEES